MTSLRVGTDFSGMEAPIEALKQLGISFKHIWSCEIDKFCRQTINANCKPDKMYIDITQRNHQDLPEVDLYIAGFPCQSFSIVGKREGTKDSRGLLMNECISTIKHSNPNVFILENVKNFKFIQNGEVYEYLLTSLESIKDTVDNEQLYEIYPHIYNTKDYGIPQNRERLYIIGIQKWILIDTFKIPKKVPMTPLEDFILDKTVYHLKTIKSKALLSKLKQINYKKDYIFPNTNFSSPSFKIVPTLTSKTSEMYHTNYHRFLSIQECLLLQGFPKDFRVVISKRQVSKQIGNSMSVNVLKAIFQEIFRCTLLYF